MSERFNTRLLWVVPVAVLGSWLAFRTQAASTTTTIVPSPVVAISTAPSVASGELKDTALARRLSRMAALARQK